MEVLEFMKTMQKICASHLTCENCEFKKIPGQCNLTGRNADLKAIIETVMRWEEDHKYDVTPSDIDELKGNLVKLENRFTEVIEKIDELIDDAGECQFGLCDSTRKSARESYDRAKQLIENYHSMMDEAEVGL